MHFEQMFVRYDNVQMALMTFNLVHRRNTYLRYLTLRWPRGVDATPPLPPPNRFFQFFSGRGRAFLQTKLLPVGSSLGYLSMKTFSDRTYRLGSKIRQRGVQKLIYFSDHEDDIQS